MVSMTAKEYTKLMHSFDPKDEAQRKLFEKITYRYPYFQSAYAHYLKTLKEQEQYNYKLILRKTAVLSPSRAFLNNWLENNVPALPKAVVKNPVPAVVENEKTTELKVVNSTAKKKEPTPLPTSVPKISKKVASQKKAKEKIEKKEPLAMTYAEWVIYSSKGKVEPKKEAISLDDKLSLIDSFLENKPKIPPVTQDQPKVDLSDLNKFNKEEFMTETLARIYVQQKKYKKALYAYQILSLKYPEKNGFFADQIKTIKQLQQNS